MVFDSYSGKTRILSCSFCGKTQIEVRKLIAGPPRKSDGRPVYICNECVLLCNEVLGEKRDAAAAMDNDHKRNLSHEEMGSDVEIGESSILLLGSTGTGKRLIARTLARLLHVRFCIVDATTLLATVKRGGVAVLPPAANT